MTRIQLRHDTAANFASVNPVLLAGEVGVETDTNKFKFGDGTTAWNSLSYQGGDLTNYYNKTQTDKLLNEKQDTFTPTSPLAMRQAPPITGNMDINAENGTAVTSLGSSFAPTYGSNAGIVSYKTPASSDADYIKEHFWDDVSYIDIPYTFPQTVCAGSQIRNTTNNRNCIIIGKYDTDGSFVPMFWCDGSNFIDASSSTLSYEVNFGNNGYFIRANNATTYYGSVSTIPGKPYENDRAYGKVFQAWTSGQLGASFGINVTFATADPQTLASALSTATVARVCAYHDFGETDYPINLKHSNYFELGVYNYNQALYVGNLTTQGALGTNLFDITDTTRPYYLDLSVGSGLAIRDGNLVNTNPTPVTVDQTYNASSTNAQSGVAIAGAGFLKDNSSKDTSLYIGQNYTSAREHATVIGRDIQSTVNSSTCVGYATEGTGESSVAMGYKAKSQGDYSIAIGSTAITMFTQDLAIGYQALTSASHAIQLGTGTNSTQGTFQVGDYQLLDSSGKIPDARLNSTVLLTSTGVSSTDIRTIVKLTQAQYDALTTKDATTFYVIVADSNS